MVRPVNGVVAVFCFVVGFVAIDPDNAREVAGIISLMLGGMNLYATLSR